MVKKLLAFLLTVCMVASMGIVPAFAMEPYAITYNIHSEGENNVTAETGDVITVTFEMIRTDGNDETYYLNSYQNEIEYDMEFFELDESSIEMTYAHEADLDLSPTRTTGQEIILATDTDVTHDKQHIVCTFNLRVKGTYGSGTVRTSEGFCSAWDNSTNKAVQNVITPKNLTVTIDSSSIVNVQGVSVTPKTATLTAVGETLTLTPQVSPNNASNKSVTYSSNNESVATVSDNGVVTAVSNGIAVITVTTVDGNKTATCTVTVNIPSTTVPVTGVSVSPTSKSLKVGETVQLVATVSPQNATNKAVTYVSSKPSVATVSETGLVTAKVAGTTTITVTTVDGNKTATSAITVTSSGGGNTGGGNVSTKKYTLTFNTDGGSEVDSLEAKEGTKITLDKYVSEKSGYKFDGWYSDKELTKKVTEITLNKDTTIYAKWVVSEDKPTVEKPDYKPGILTDEHYAYIVGREGGMIAPESDITRAEVATIIYRLLDEDERNKAKTNENVFTDVNEDDWFNTAVSTLASLELVKGRTTDTFAPNAFITRAELATIFARMVEVEYDGKVLFSDVSGHWAESYINEAATAEWIVGYNGLFRPDDNITRAEVMTLVNRVLNREPESKADLLDGMTTWKDNANENAWYYLAVQEATNSHTYEMKADGKHEKWTSLTENPDWSKIED